ncbi:hypothetical protein KVR01_000620 [Diaporthe batatas]|uniref:uncharacterized protein n=1 Tax=Diaporthe batatas TaxID=748121 RepID=UPI001D045F17|nr:uncharacterized protein KVR01_000620 [Diaporthe batatas]KAG8169875.1 hypothetical protein KVR01_000620 [Diaporthe batatas]
MAVLKRFVLFAALSCTYGLGMAQSGESSSSSSSSSKTKILQTTNYIDTIDGYSSLSSCAIEVLSTIVRGEFSGCGGWDNMLTSYTCFCTDSYSFMSSAISTDVIESCDSGVTASAQATSALAIFDEYCALGVEAGLEPTPESGRDDNPTATPGATGAAATSTQAADAEAAANSARTAAIAAGVVVPVVVIAVAVSAWLIWRKRRRANAGNWNQWNEGGDTGNHSAYGSAPVRDANAVEAPTYEHKTVESPYSPHTPSEMSPNQQYSPHQELSAPQHSTSEMPANNYRSELPG